MNAGILDVVESRRGGMGALGGLKLRLERIESSPRTTAPPYS